MSKRQLPSLVIPHIGVMQMLTIRQQNICIIDAGITVNLVFSDSVPVAYTLTNIPLSCVGLDFTIVITVQIDNYIMQYTQCGIFVLNVLYPIQSDNCVQMWRFGLYMHVYTKFIVH